MRKLLLCLAVAAAALGCQKQHPINVQIDPVMRSDAPRTIAVLPVLSALHHAEDPDEVAPATVEQLLIPEINKRKDYEFLSQGTVRYAVELEEMESEFDLFLREYPKQRRADVALFKSLGDALKCDAFMVVVVDMWQKDEVDVQENATPATYVGATISIFNKEDGKLLFRATDEDYMEGARTETADRSLVTGASGAIRSDLGAKVHRAPPFEEVAVKVVQALVLSIPAR